MSSQGSGRASSSGYIVLCLNTWAVGEESQRELHEQSHQGGTLCVCLGSIKEPGSATSPLNIDVGGACSSIACLAETYPWPLIYFCHDGGQARFCAKDRQRRTQVYKL